MDKVKEKTIKYFIGDDEPTGKKYCKICQKLYVKEKGCAKHVAEIHENDLIFENRLKLFKKEINIEQLRIYKVQLTTIFTKNEENWKKARAEFFKKLKDEYSIESVLSWRAEDIVKAEERYKIIKSASNYFDYLNIAETWNKDKIIELRDNIKKEIKDIKKRLIDYPYRHNSTSLMSNAVEEWKAYARCESVNNKLSIIGLTAVVYWAERIIKLI